MLKSYKTTILGIAILAVVLTKIMILGYDVMTDAPGILAGFGFIVAKDNNVTGGGK